MKMEPGELTRLQKREAIAHDDHSASCTALGWSAYQRRHARSQLSPDDIVPNANHWVARLVDNPEKTIDIECERWSDARSFAIMVAGGVEVTVEPSYPVLERWQVKWAGSALDPHDGVHMVARIVKPLNIRDLLVTKKNYADADPFLPVRELSFS
jgi:hypothetical protein